MSSNEQTIEELSEKLGINPDNILHLVLSNGWEVFAEIVDTAIEIELEDGVFDDEEFTSNEDEINNELIPENNDVIAFHPLRVIRDSFISSDGNHVTESFFIEYNAYSKNPWIPINPAQIISKDHPDDGSILEYLTILETLYFLEENVKDNPEIKKSKTKSKNNVVNLADYYNLSKKK